MYVEAAWRPGHPASKTEPAETAAICLSKKRWATIPTGPGFCLPDPRRDPEAFFCDDPFLWESILEITDNALLFNDSAFVDLGLYRWSPPLGPDNYTTSHYPDLGIRTVNMPQGFVYTPPGPPQPSFEGTTFNHATAYLPPDPAVLTNLCTYQAGIVNPIYKTTTNISDDCLPAPGGFFLPPPDPLVDPDPREGKIYDPDSPRPANAVPLYLYGTGSAFITTTDATLPYSSEIIGYLPQPRR
jgi:hypothetical protein